MIGLALSLRLDGSPAEASDVARLAGGLGHRPSDRRRTVVAGAAALAATEWLTLPEESTAAQPYERGSGAVVLLDGRIDNRRELSDVLGLPAGEADVAFVAAAYDRFGRDLARHLHGDFALVVWDPARRRLVAARDRLGIKALVWARHGDRLLVGSEVAQVARALAPSARRMNEGVVAELLSGWMSHPTETLVAGVERLAPARILVVEDGVLEISRYWDLEFADRTKRSQTVIDLGDRFIDIVGGAVADRVRTLDPIGVELSGGMDSATVAALAHRALRDRADLASHLRPLVMDYEPGSLAHETAHWRSVCAHLALEPLVVAGDVTDLEVFERDVLLFADVPGTPESAAWHHLGALAARHGIRVRLTGQWGDEWFRPTVAHLADSLWRGSPGRAWTDTRLWGETTTTGRLAVLARHGAASALRHGAPGLWARLRPGRRVPPHLRPAFVASTALHDRLAPLPAPAGTTPAQAELYRHLHRGGAAWSTEVTGRASAAYGLEERHPFADHRVVEFAASLPETARGAGDVERGLQRGALAALLPSSVRARTDKADFAAPAVAQIEAMGGIDALARIERAHEDWFVPGGLVEGYRAFCSGETGSAALYGAWAALHIDQVWAELVG